MDKRYGGETPWREMKKYYEIYKDRGKRKKERQKGRAEERESLLYNVEYLLLHINIHYICIFISIQDCLSYYFLKAVIIHVYNDN